MIQTGDIVEYERHSFPTVTVKALVIGLEKRSMYLLIEGGLLRHILKYRIRKIM